MSLQTLTYVSSAATLLDDAELYRLLEESRDRNISHGITGLLLYADGTFMQTIEGEAAEIQQLFSNITRDGRHHGVIKMIHDDIGNRAFPDWTMGFRDGSKAVAGFTDYLDSNHGLELHGPIEGYAKQLFLSFKAGLSRGG